MKDAGYEREYSLNGADDFYEKLYETIKDIDEEVFDAGLIKSPEPKATNPSQSDLQVTKTINNTDVQYKICTFGSKFHIGFGVPVTIEYNGHKYECKTHNSTKGRIDGLGQLYKDNNISVGDVLRASYSYEKSTITLK